MAANQQQIDIGNMSLDQLNQLKTRHEQEIQNYNAQYGDMRQLESRFRESRKALEVIAEGPEERSMLVPLTQSLYVPGQILDSDKVLVDIGTGYYLEKSVEDAKKLVDRRVDLITKNGESVNSVMLQKQRNLEAIMMMMQYKLQQIQEKKADFENNK